MAQYTWNAQLPLPDFRRLAVPALYGAPEGVDLISAHQSYEQTVAAYVRLHLNGVDTWRNPGAAWKFDTDRLTSLIQKAADRSEGLEALRLRGWAQDTRILGLEIELRRKVRGAYLRYQSAANASEPEVRRRDIGESWRQIEEARHLCRLLEQERAERGLLLVAPINYTGRQTAAVEKLADLVGAALNQDHIPPNRWEDADLLWRRYRVW